MLGCLKVDSAIVETCGRVVSHPMNCAGGVSRKSCLCLYTVRAVLGDNAQDETRKPAREGEELRPRSIFFFLAAEMMGLRQERRHSEPSQPEFLVVGPRPDPHVNFVLIISQSPPLFFFPLSFRRADEETYGCALRYPSLARSGQKLVG